MRYLVVRTENLAKDFRHKPALIDLTLEVEPGEVFGVLGPKGAGKSTFFHILLDFVRPSRGYATIFGLDCQRQSLAVRRQVGYLPQEVKLPSEASFKALIQRFGTLRGKVDWERVHSLAERLGLDIDQPVASAGRVERQKFGLVQAFMHSADLVLLDEPARGLDACDQAELHCLIGEARAEGRTVMVASDSLTEMERICDRVAVLHCGRLVTVERGVQLRSRAVRKVELRFGNSVRQEAFAGLPNLNNLVFDQNKLSCTLQGNPDALIKVASQFRIMDFISQQPSLEEVYQTYYGIEDHVA